MIVCLFLVRIVLMILFKYLFIVLIVLIVGLIILEWLIILGFVKLRMIVLCLLVLIFLISVFFILYVFILGFKLYVVIFGELMRICFLFGNLVLWLLFIKNVMCGYFLVFVI